MNIAIFTDTYLPDINGVASSVYTLADALQQRGHKAYIFTVSKEKKEERSYKWIYEQLQKWLSEDEDSEGEKAARQVYRLMSIPLAFLKPHRAGTPISLNVFRLMKKLDIDVIHTQTEFTMGFMGLSMSSAFRLPMVHTYHTMYEDYTHYIAKGAILTPDMARSFSKTFCNWADAVIAPTCKTSDSLLSYGVKRNIYTVPTGINLRPFSKAAYSADEILRLKKSLSLAPEWPIILSIGRIAKEKSLDQLICAMPEILKKKPDARLLLVGAGPDLENLQELTRSLHLRDRVIFAGRVPYEQIGKYYQLGDVFACCSTSETQGLTYYEAMAAGVPLLVKRDKSVEGVLTDRENAILFDDSAELPEKIRELLTDSALRETCVRNSAAIAEIYSAERFGQCVEDVYINVIDQVHMRRGIKNYSPKKVEPVRSTKRRQLRSKKLPQSSVGYLGFHLFSDRGTWRSVLRAAAKADSKKNLSSDEKTEGRFLHLESGAEKGRKPEK